MRIIPNDHFLRLQQAAIKAGALGHPLALQWDISGGCSDKLTVSFQRARSIMQGVIDLYVPCRNCATCLKRRARQWAGRAGHEVAGSNRTWFGTYTFAAPVRALVSERIAKLPYAERSGAMHKHCNEYVGLYLKKVRKRGLRIRYVFVPEHHKDGWIHFHSLIHGDADLRWKDVTEPWVWGFSKLKLVTEPVRNIRYVMKYLAKAKLGRVRASLAYGKTALAHSAMIARGKMAAKHSEDCGGLTPQQISQEWSQFLEVVSEWGILDCAETPALEGADLRAFLLRLITGYPPPQ